jgi:hypothetical protein
LVTLILFAARVGAAETPPHAADSGGSGQGRGTTFWAGAGLLAGGLGLTAFGLARSGCGSMMGGSETDMMSGTSMGPMMGGGRPGSLPPPATPQTGTAFPRPQMSHQGHGGFNAAAIAVGVAAATAGLVMVLASRKDGRPAPSLSLKAGLGRMDVAFSF